jgi:hypothetical protein
MARDFIHEAVKRALVKDGWTVTDDPLHIKYKDLELQADLGAERPIAAVKAGRKIAVEIKSFVGRSLISELYTALEQYVVYLDLLQETEPDRKLYLAVSDLVFNDFFQLEAVQLIVAREQLAMLVVNTATEEVTQWIN